MIKKRGSWIEQILITKNTPLKKVLELGKQPLCGKLEKCRICCAFGSPFLIKDDISRIAKHFGLSNDEFINKHCDDKYSKFFVTRKIKLKTKNTGKPYGACIFFDDCECRIHKIKPLQCRIANCNENGQKLSNWFAKKYLLEENQKRKNQTLSNIIKQDYKTRIRKIK
ncbi:MAG TPA: YkgJ family cysteine cluster protein [Candidatus Nanoarchaeia archaeon]|nr:YkgJ family cysteine cluster protein [Candidatus Nanoarchaeia archaeon]